MSSGSSKSTVLQRPIALLYPLEINCKSTTITVGEGETAVQNEGRLDREVSTEQVGETSGRPRREAAARAAERVKTWMSMLNDKPG